MVARIVRYSDISGEPEEGEGKTGKLVFRYGPGITTGKALAADVLPHEVELLTSMSDAYVVEYIEPGAKPSSKPKVYVLSAEQLQDLIAPSGKRLKDFLKGLRYNRGRESAVFVSRG